jgi:hypothetical protein
MPPVKKKRSIQNSATASFEKWFTTLKNGGQDNAPP